MVPSELDREIAGHAAEPSVAPVVLWPNRGAIPQHAAGAVSATRTVPG